MLADLTSIFIYTFFGKNLGIANLTAYTIKSTSNIANINIFNSKALNIALTD